MNKIHSCTEARPAAACSFLSLRGAGWFSGCLRDGVAWRGPGGGGLTLESFAGFQRGGSHQLTHLRLSPEIAARQLAPLWCVTGSSPCPHPPASPTPGEFDAQTAPGDTPGTTCAAAAATTPAPTRRHPRAASPAGTRWHACHQPRHTPVTTLPAPGTGRHGPGVCGTPGSSPRPGVGMEGDRGRRTTLLAHVPRGPSPALRRHVPAWTRPSTPPVLPGGAGG